MVVDVSCSQSEKKFYRLSLLFLGVIGAASAKSRSKLKRTGCLDTVTTVLARHVLLNAMSRNKGHSGKDAILPADVEWVTILTTDGDSQRLPTNTTPNPDAEGHVNYMQPLGLDNPFAVKWRLAIGKALAEMHKYPNYSTYYLKIQKDVYMLRFYRGQDLGASSMA